MDIDTPDNSHALALLIQGISASKDRQRFIELAKEAKDIEEFAKLRRQIWGDPPSY